MSRNQIRYILLLLTLLSIEVTPALSQKSEKPSIPLDYFYADPVNTGGFRKILSKLHFGLDIGYGYTFYNQNLDGYAILQQSDSTPLLFSNTEGGSGTVPVGYRYWYNTLSADSAITINAMDDFLVSSDTADISYKAPGHSIPITATIHVELMNRYKIGVGFMFEYHRPGEFSNNLYSELQPIQPNFNNAFFKKYFVILGGNLYRYYNYLISADARIGIFKLGGNFDKALMKKSVYVNAGVMIEREFSEYFSLYVRPSFDYKGYSMNSAIGDPITTRMNGLFIGIGAIYRIPQLRKCFLKNCTTQINHQHGNKEYRSRVHSFWKNQNPHYGENYPRLIKYKKKNRNKMNPY